GSANIAYNWTDVANVSAGTNIFFANASTMDWANLIAASLQTHVDAEDTSLGLSGPDNVSNTFDTTTNPEIAVDSVTIGANTAFATTTKDGDEADTWSTTLTMDDTNGNKAYVGQVGQGNNAFNGAAANYQVMVPTSDAGTRDYWVFVQI
ncbi:MAG: hypothetical protein ACQESG_04260, partial [Nanobdellota archaeon]